jgi:hypothetical protein
MNEPFLNESTREHIRKTSTFVRNDKMWFTHQAVNICVPANNGPSRFETHSIPVVGEMPRASTHACDVSVWSYVGANIPNGLQPEHVVYLKSLEDDSPFEVFICSLPKPPAPEWFQAITGTQPSSFGAFGAFGAFVFDTKEELSNEIVWPEDRDSE